MPELLPTIETATRSGPVSPPRPVVPSSRPDPTTPVYLGPVRLPSRYFLAPLAGYTNLALRRTVRELGGLGLATTDLVNARALVEGSRKTDELIASAPDDRPTAVQIFGSEPDYLRAAAQMLVSRGYGHIDINMGCPVHKVTKNGGGSAMMCDTSGRTVDLVRAVVEAVPVPVTVKMRLGWDDRQLTAPWFARAFEQAGVAAVTIHGRTREQGFHGTVNLDGIRRVVEAVERIPVVGNGDVRTLADAARMFAATGCHAIALGRGALLNPWIFRELQAWEETGDPGPPPTYFDRLRFMETHVRRLCDLRGERWGCIQFRKVANWYCKVLKPGREVQQTLVMLDTLATFDRIVTRLRDQGLPPGWQAGAAPNIPVPKGPIDKW
jgi:tRNA-dihydrouridine synthase B